MKRDSYDSEYFLYLVFFIYKKTLTYMYRWQISGFDQNPLMEEECFVDSKDSQKIHSGVQN